MVSTVQSPRSASTGAEPSSLRSKAASAAIYGDPLRRSAQPITANRKDWAKNQVARAGGGSRKKRNVNEGLRARRGPRAARTDQAPLVRPAPPAAPSPNSQA